MNSNFLIEDNDLGLAKDVCKYISDELLRNRAAANVSAAKIALKFFDNIEVDVKSGLHNICSVLEDLEISDIYIKGQYIDVRLFFNENELCVPKSHFTRGLTPVAYMFIKIEPDLAGASVIGFIQPSNIEQNDSNEEYYQVKESELVSFYDIEPLLLETISPELPDNFESMIFSFLDGHLEEKDEFYKLLLTSEEGRFALQKAYKAKVVLSLISVNKEVEAVEESFDLNAETEDLSGDLEEIETLELDDSFTSELEEFDSEPMEEIESIEEFSLEEKEEPIEESVIEDEIEEIAIAEEPLVEEAIEEPALETEEEPVIYETIETIEEKEESPQEIEDYVPEIEDFSTTTTPSIDSLVEEDLDFEPEEEEEIVPETSSENEEQIKTLFNQPEENVVEEEYIAPKKKASLIPILGVVALIGALGYFGYTKFAAPQMEPPAEVPQEQPQRALPQEDAMPVETVENTKIQTMTEEGNAVSIPAIEQNLDASILVSNLSVYWEVPDGYVSNATAKRYFNKLGKIIQLNLKSELLLLSKPPITNKIVVELEFNPKIQKFDIKGITESSGEAQVDKIITNTIKKALDMNLSMNMSTLSKIQGNPALVIKL